MNHAEELPKEAYGLNDEKAAVDVIAKKQSFMAVTWTPQNLIITKASSKKELRRKMLTENLNLEHSVIVRGKQLAKKIAVVF